MSAASSGGVLSSITLIASIIECNESIIALYITSEEISTLTGRPDKTFLPKPGAKLSATGTALPNSFFIFSAVLLPITRL